MQLDEFNEKAGQLRTLIELARQAEVVAYEEMKGLQSDMIKAITAEDVAKLDTLETRYNEIEEHWRNCTLYTAELRAEMQDLIKERHGERPLSASGDGHAATTRLAAQAGAPRSVSSPFKVKAVQITSSEVSPTRKNLLRAANPDVNPRYTSSGTLPIGDAQIRIEFDRLLQREPSPFAADGLLSFQTLVSFFSSQETMGVPLDTGKWILRNLAKLDAETRKIVQRVNAAETLEFSDRGVDYQKFAFLMVRWAQH